MVTKYKYEYVTGIAGNVDFRLDVPKGLKHSIYSIRIKLVNDATVANRYIHPDIYDIQTNRKIIDLGASAVIVASQTGYMQYVRPSAGDWHPKESGGHVTGYIVLPDNGLIIYEGQSFRIDIADGQAGDAYEVDIVYLVAPENEDFHP